MQKRFSTFLAASALVTLAACGGDGGPNWADEVDEETAVGAAETAASYAANVAYYMLQGDFSTELPDGPLAVAGTATPNLTERLTAMVRQRAYRRIDRPDLAASPSPFRVGMACEAVISGDLDEFGEPNDDDGDEVPNDVTVSFPANCTEPDGDATIQWSGSLRFRDVAGLYGFRLDVNNFRVRWFIGDEYEQIKVDGFETATYASNGITHSADMTQEISFRFDEVAVTSGLMPASAAATAAIALTVKESASYDPDGPITLEADIPSGTLTFTMDHRLVIAASSSEGSESYAYRFTMVTTDPLDIDAVTCYGPVDGTIVGDLNGNDDVGFTINWSACETYTIEVRGTTEPEGPVLE